MTRVCWSYTLLIVTVEDEYDPKCAGLQRRKKKEIYVWWRRIDNMRSEKL